MISQRYVIPRGIIRSIFGLFCVGRYVDELVFPKSAALGGKWWGYVPIGRSVQYVFLASEKSDV